MTAFRRSFTRLCFLLLSLPGLAAAQTVTSTTGAINGTVTDTSKVVMPGVTVALAGPALMGTNTTVTDQNGVYRFSTVPLGDYTLTFELSGFGTVRREGLRIGAGFTATVNVVMNPGTLQESVTVSGAAPVGGKKPISAKTCNRSDLWGPVGSRK